MAYEPYATTEDYAALVPDGVEVAEDDLRRASRHIDSLTFNRIVTAGFGSLTPFQREIVREVVCRQAAFEKENADALATVLSGYAINSVEMRFGGGENALLAGGIPMRREDAELLAQTGLCCRLAR